MSVRVPADVMLTSDREHMNWLRELAKAVNSVRSGSFTWDPPNVGAGAVVDTALDAATYPGLSGLVAGMPVTATPPAITAGLIVSAWVSAADELTVRLTNITAAPIDEPSAAWSFLGVTL